MQVLLVPGQLFKNEAGNRSQGDTSPGTGEYTFHLRYVEGLR